MPPQAKAFTVGVPARELIKKFLDFVRPALEEFREGDEVYSIAQETMQQGNGAARQREVYKRTNSLEDVVDFVVRVRFVG